MVAVTCRQVCSKDAKPAAMPSPHLADVDWHSANQRVVPNEQLREVWEPSLLAPLLGHVTREVVRKQI